MLQDGQRPHPGPDQSSGVAEAGVAPEPHFGHHARILVVDDQKLLNRFICRTLQNDATCYSAHDGESALAMCREHLPDLVLLDVELPDMDGYRVCRLLKADPRTRNIPVIFATGNLDPDDEVKGFEAGAVDFIHKPINPAITRARVNTQLTLKRQIDALRRALAMDGLTGVANRDAFDRELASLWDQDARDGRPLSLIMVDVDSFRAYNDAYGQAAGDTCLQRVAGAIRGQIHRSQDLAARYGGGLFACLLRDTDADGAASVAATILLAIRNLGIERAGPDADGIVTANLGVATAIPSPGTSPDALIAEVQRYLGIAKSLGRGCMITAADAV
ncbi:diguanylate cyclase [Azospirillum sp. RWY-5-1]|uniref:diguanylate cyclase n=2 Tax=Azospirillum oleiclasticum TaxID=2735135 RepID=A0ABX2THG9_9PROT|nr:diguanylate cyclase [Azospirillum oleiclasticum]NYZ23804.1 diguanylate cyclase [Azospirillum oleiclasticum]